MKASYRPNGSRRVATPSGGERVTDGSQAESVDINNIVKQFTKTGLMPQRQGARYEDVSSHDYMAMRNFIADKESLFRGLPARVRARFGGDFYQLLRWIENPANREEAVKLGIFDASKANQEQMALQTAPKAPKAPEGEGVEDPFEPEDDLPRADPEANPRPRKNPPPKGGRR